MINIVDKQTTRQQIINDDSKKGYKGEYREAIRILTYVDIGLLITSDVSVSAFKI